MRLDIKKLLEETDVSTAEVSAYVKYFDWKRRNGLKRKWEHYTVRAFIISVAYLGNGYYSALRKVKDEVQLSDPGQAEEFSWLRGWILQRDIYGQFWVIVDGNADSFDMFKEKYREIRWAGDRDGEGN